jgi:predicted acyltransferase
MPTAGAPARERLLSLDVYRGLCVIGMMLVDWTGNWAHVYPIFKHANWLGITLADFVFPSLLFIAGVAIPLAVDRDGPAGPLYRRLVRRCLLLFACGVLLNVIWDWEPGVPLLDKLRIMGVLQRYALVYPAAVLLYRALPARRLAALAAVLLVAYWLVMAFVPVPGFGAPDLTINPHGRPLTPTLATWIDLHLLGKHMAIYYPHDPEGFLTTVPSLVTTLLGVLAGLWWRQPLPAQEKLNRLFAWGVGLVVSGYLWGFAFPISKKLWTSSFVLFTGGFALLVLASLLWRVDVRERRGGTGLAVAYGSNPLLAIMAFTFIDNLLRVIPVSRRADGSAFGLKDFIYERALQPWLAPRNASWVYSVIGILLLGLLFQALYRRRLFLRA